MALKRDVHKFITSSGAQLLWQRETCYCRNGQITTVEEYWCEDSPAGYYCSNASTSLSSFPIPPGTVSVSLRGLAEATRDVRTASTALKELHPLLLSVLAAAARHERFLRFLSGFFAVTILSGRFLFSNLESFPKPMICAAQANPYPDSHLARKHPLRLIHI